MTKFSNIEKHPLHRGEYLGYTAKGYGRRIKKSTGSYGNWVAYPHPGEGQRAIALYAHRLSDLSRKLQEI